MIEILFATDKEKLIPVDKPVLASGDVKTVSITVEFDGSWDGYGKSAVFFRKGEPDVYEVVMQEGNTCEVPHEVLDKPGFIIIGVRGVKDDKVYTSTLVSYKVENGAPEGTGESVPPTPDVYQQILSNYGNAIQAINQEKSDREKAIAKEVADREKAIAKEVADREKAIAKEVADRESDVDGIEAKVYEVKERVPFGFGIDVDNNYGFIPEGSDKVIPFNPSGLEEVHSGMVTGGSNPLSITIINKGKAIIDLTLQKNAPETYTYTYTIKKNGTEVKSEQIGGAVGLYTKIVEVNVEKDDIIMIESSEVGNLNIAVTLYVTGVTVGGEPVYNKVLSRLQEVEDEARGSSETVAGFQGELTELKGDLDKLVVIEKSINKCDESKLSYGRYTVINDGVTTPAFVDNTTSVLTDFIPIDNTKTYFIPMVDYNGTMSILCNGICVFDSNKNPIGSIASVANALNLSQTFNYDDVSYVRAWWTEATYNGKYYIGFSDTTEKPQYVPYIKYIKINDDVRLKDNDDYKELERSIDAIYYRGIGANKCDKSKMTDGRYSSINDGVTSPVFINDNARTITDFIEIPNGATYVSGGAFATDGNWRSSQYNGICVFNSNMNPLGSVASQDAPLNITTTFPYDDVKYIRIWWSKSSYPDGYSVCFGDNANMYAPNIPFSEITEVKSKNWFEGKLGECMGDSITKQGTWEGFVSVDLDCYLVNNGVGGSTISSTTTREDDFFEDTRLNALSNDADFVIIMGGTNDGLNNRQIGEISRDNFDVTTVCGAFNVLLSKLDYKYRALDTGFYSSVDYSGTQKRTDSKDVKIFIATPIYCASTKFAAETKDSMDYIAEAIKQIAWMWGIPCIDIHGTCGINAFNEGYYLKDHVHPNDKGGYLLANAMINGLKSNSPVDIC